MNIYIDCEFNGYRGQLISMALVPAQGPEFYEVLPCRFPDPWVAAHVIPNLNKKRIQEKVFLKKLQEYLKQFDSINLIADWFDDIKYFTEVICHKPGETIASHGQMTFQVIRIDAKSLLPHNALEDARAIKEHLEGTL